jgi:mono/diheme cytochrome c family protein
VSRRTLALELLLAALAVFVAIAFSDDLGKATRRKVYEQQFPEGEGKAIAERSCLICHSQTLVTQQAKDSTAWEKTLGTMEKWGVKLTHDEHDSLRTYLVTHFGPRPKKK